MLIIMHGLHNLDYKKTSLAPYIKVFEQFLENLDKSRKGELLKKSGKTIFFPFSYLDLSTGSLKHPANKSFKSSSLCPPKTSY